MGQQQYYYQCRLRRTKRLGEVEHQVSWIPAQYAQKGRILKLKRNGHWDNGWEVIDIWERKTREEVLERSRYYCYQRDASDI